AVGDTAPQSDISCVSSHNLDDTYTFVRSRSIADFINSFHSCIYGGIKTDGILCTCNIQVNGTRYAYSVYPQICQFLSTGERTVTADYHKAVDTMFFTDFSGSSLAFFCTHFCTAGSIQDSSALLDSI